MQESSAIRISRNPSAHTFIAKTSLCAMNYWTLSGRTTLPETAFPKRRLPSVLVWTRKPSMTAREQSASHLFDSPTTYQFIHFRMGPIRKRRRSKRNSTLEKLSCAKIAQRSAPAVHLTFTGIQRVSEGTADRNQSPVLLFLSNRKCR